MGTQDRVRVPVSNGSGAENEKDQLLGAGASGVVELVTANVELGEGAGEVEEGEVEEGYIGSEELVAGVRDPVSDGFGAENVKDQLPGAGVSGVVELVTANVELGEGAREAECSEVEEGYIGSEGLVAGDADLGVQGDCGGTEGCAAAEKAVPCGGSISDGGQLVEEGYIWFEGLVAGDADLRAKGDCGGTEKCAAAEEGVLCGGNVSDGGLLVHDEGGDEMEEGQILEKMEVDMDLSESPVRGLDGRDPSAVVSIETKNEILISNQKYPAVSGNKRARMTYNEQQPSVHVTYNSLTRASKRKLEELLQKWSEWHVQRDSSSQDLNEVLESGENTYFPALRVGLEKPSSVLFWMENQTANLQSRSMNSPDGNSVPFYDREYALGLTSEDGRSNIEGGLEIVGDPARCFNCGAYNHSLKECPKPRDIVAVNSARKQLKLKKMQNSGSRNASRYYQNSSGGKYDGLKPGALDGETKKALGLGELDPPPWLFRMRELGYPPGYLDPDEDDQPSGITIFADGDAKEEDDGEISGRVSTEPKKKMSVEFPGINALIPENADKEIWTAAPSGSDPLRSRSNHRPMHSESYSRWRPQEDRWRMDGMDDGPPGVDPPCADSVLSPSSSSYPPRYGSYDLGNRRSSHERDGRGTLVYEDFISCSPHDSFHGKHFSSADYGSSRYTYGSDRVRDDNGLDSLPRRSYEYDRYHHHSRR